MAKPPSASQSPQSGSAVRKRFKEGQRVCFRHCQVVENVRAEAKIWLEHYGIGIFLEFITRQKYSQSEQKTVSHTFARIWPSYFPPEEAAIDLKDTKAVRSPDHGFGRFLHPGSSRRNRKPIIYTDWQHGEVPPMEMRESVIAVMLAHLDTSRPRNERARPKEFPPKEVLEIPWPDVCEANVAAFQKWYMRL